MHIVGARAECAAYLWTRNVIPGVQWVRKYEDLENVPDLVTPFIEIDVKAIEKPHHSLIAPNPKPHWAYFLVDASAHPRYRMVKWFWGRNLMEPERMNKNLPRAAYQAMQGDMWELESLVALAAAAPLPRERA